MLLAFVFVTTERVTAVAVTVAAVAVIELVMVVVVVALLVLFLVLFVVVVIVVGDRFVVVVIRFAAVVKLRHAVVILNETEVTTVIVVALSINKDLVRWATSVTLIANDVGNLTIALLIRFLLLNDWLVIVAEVDLVIVVVLIKRVGVLNDNILAVVIDVAVLVIGVIVTVVTVSVTAAIGVNLFVSHDFALHAETEAFAKSEIHASHDFALERLVHAAPVSEEIKIGATESVDRVLLGGSLVLTITVCSVIEHVRVEVENFSAKATIR